MNKEYTERGFRVYGSIIDGKGSRVWVQKSSAADRRSVWIFCENSDPNYESPQPHLTVEQATEIIGLLQTFVEETIMNDDGAVDRMEADLADDPTADSPNDEQAAL